MQTELNAAIAEVQAAMRAKHINLARVDWLEIVKAARYLIEQRKAQSAATAHSE
jgi:hypothetical protein